jgi:hypothetical protein
LKQLQLIQILCINPPDAGAAAVAAANVPAVNLLWLAPERTKAASGNAGTAFRVEKSGILEGRRFTAR